MLPQSLQGRKDIVVGQEPVIGKRLLHKPSPKVNSQKSTSIQRLSGSPMPRRSILCGQMAERIQVPNL
jgi:hypothetical protein